MTPIRKELLDSIACTNCYDRSRAELQPLRLAAARELFAERVTQIPVLQRRARDCGITEIRGFEDLVPLLFSHTVYKSYPAELVEQKRWDRLLLWLKTLSVQDPTTVDMSGVEDLDGWIDRLRGAGHLILATSGSSGKCSFLNSTRGDLELKTRHFANMLGWPHLRPNADRSVFQLGPRRGPNSAVEAARIGAQLWGRPGEIHFLTEEPLRISTVSQMAAIRRRIAEGRATPGEIAGFEAQAARQAARMRDGLHALTDRILAARHEPIVLSGLWSQHMAIIERAHELGIPDGDFHPQSYISAGGGVKGVRLPEDYHAQVDRFYGNVFRGTGYGMTEQAQVMPRCEAKRYHVPPGLIMLLLDRPGEALLEPPADAGIVEGRFAFVDLLFEGLWGGLISGDKVHVDFAARCPCGRWGPCIVDDISRYAQAGEDDHIGCAGTIDAYVRGAMNA